jgi:hypothetical protein
MAKFFMAFIGAALIVGALLSGTGGSKVSAQPVPSASAATMMPMPSASPTGMTR